MAFNEVKKGKFAPSARKVKTVTISGSGKHCVVTISNDLDLMLGQPSHLKVLLGDGRDEGAFRLAPAQGNNGGYRVQRKKNADGTFAQSTASIGLYPKQLGLPTVKFPRQSLTFTAWPTHIECNLPEVKQGR